MGLRGKERIIRFFTGPIIWHYRYMKDTMIMDMHVHTTISSCSALTLEQILDNAAAVGLDGVCITDHDTMDVRHEIKEGVQDNGLCVIFGMEYSTPDGDFLLFGPFEDLKPGLDARRLLHLVQSAGGVAVAAHPFRPGRGVSEFAVSEGLCSVVESINGRNMADANERSREWLERYDVAASGGSDAHTLDELGCAPSRVLAPIKGRTDFIQALKAGLVEPAYAATAAGGAEGRHRLKGPRKRRVGIPLPV